VYAAQMDDVLICKIGPAHWEPPDGARWKQAETGQDWATWERR
jgi:hypothetical protein